MMALEMFSYCQSGSGQDAFRLQIGTRTCTKTTEENINAFHMSAMSGCMSVHHLSSAKKGQKKTLDPLELELLQTAMSHHEDAGN